MNNTLTPCALDAKPSRPLPRWSADVIYAATMNPSYRACFCSKRCLFKWAISHWHFARPSLFGGAR